MPLLTGCEDISEQEHDESEYDTSGTALDKGEIVSIKAGLVLRLALPVETAPAHAAVDVEVAIVVVDEAGDGGECETVVVDGGATLV